MTIASDLAAVMLCVAYYAVVGAHPVGDQPASETLSVTILPAVSYRELD